MEILLFALIGLAAGWLAGVLTEGGGLGAAEDMIIGIIGSILGGLLFRKVGIHIGHALTGRLFVATFGAVILIVVLRAVKKI